MTARLFVVLAMTGPLALGCSSEEPGKPKEEEPIVWEYPHDGLIRVNQIQLEASHNSYHLTKQPDIEPLAYTHAPLDVQLRSQGVRGFELDTWWDGEAQELAVYHIASIDDLSSCQRLVDCLSLLKSWSDENPASARRKRSRIPRSFAERGQIDAQQNDSSPDHAPVAAT
jgi:hypothetical protein